MKRIKVSEATPIQLDYLVAIAKGDSVVEKHFGDFQGFYVVIDSDLFSKVGRSYSPSSRWNQGGPIIEREHLDVCWIPANEYFPACWVVRTPRPESHRDFWVTGYGPTPLIAAMRCFVISRLGDTVEVPEELAALVKGE